MIRDLMIANMRNTIGNVSDSGRYGMYFYVVDESVMSPKQRNKLNKRNEGKINMANLEQLDDERLLLAYNVFMRRYSTWR